MPEKQIKILIVEDDVTMREIVAHKLMINGYAIVEAGEGKAAVAMWKKEEPDLVLLDLMLPELDGFQIMDAVRKEAPDAVNNAHVIILSNLFNKEDIKKAKGMGIDNFLVKAYHTTEEILTQVKEALAKNKEKAK